LCVCGVFVGCGCVCVVCVGVFMCMWCVCGVCGVFVGCGCVCVGVFMCMWCVCFNDVTYCHVVHLSVSIIYARNLQIQNVLHRAALFLPAHLVRYKTQQFAIGNWKVNAATSPIRLKRWRFSSFVQNTDVITNYKGHYKL